MRHLTFPFGFAFYRNVLCVDDMDLPVKVGKDGFRAVRKNALNTRMAKSVTDGTVMSVTSVQERFLDSG